MQEYIYYDHWNRSAHATIDAIKMTALNLLKHKIFACIEHICIYMLCTCDIPFHVGVGGGDMQSIEHHLSCNVFGQDYI